MTARLVAILIGISVCAATCAQAIDVVAEGADPTGERDCTALLTRLHKAGRPVFYPNGTYRFNGANLDLSGGVRFESLDGVTVRSDISDQNVLQFDDFGNLIGLQHNHLEVDDGDLGGYEPVTVGNLVRTPVSTANLDLKADLLAYWYNDFGLEHRRLRAPNAGWVGWYYWSWNFHRTTREKYDPARHPLLGFYRGDDPTVLDWQCYWLREYGVRGVILLAPSPSSDLDAWQAPDHPHHWAYQLFTDVPNFAGLGYVMTAYTPYTEATSEKRAEVEGAWVSLIREVYLRHGNFYTIERGGETFPVIYAHEEAALRGTFDRYNGGKGTAAFYRRMAKLFQGEGYGGLAVLARHAIGTSIIDWSELEADGVLHFVAEYANDHSSGSTYPERVANYAPPTDPNTVLNVCTAKHTHAPHPSKWECPGHSPELFGEMLTLAAAQIERHAMPRIITCYNVAEWAEGGPSLQPNMHDRFGYLEAVRNALVRDAAH